MVTFLTAPGAPTVQHLSNIYNGELDQVPKILQASATTLTRLRFSMPGSCYAVQAPHLPALRVLELETSDTAAPFRLADLFASLLTQISSAMPRLEQVSLRVTVPSVPARTPRSLQLSPTGSAPKSAWTWAHSEPLDLGSVRAVHCHLRFLDERYDPNQARERELLREEGYAGFVHCWGEQMPALRDNGSLSFSQIYIQSRVSVTNGRLVFH
ncbi:hypothetical protein B0H12DRAFT_1148438 [Mycena haematopus]|nr:hypothetical protein B0H12DRAFT_1148438 [Mycena haematopus]